MICEDLWYQGPIRRAKEAGADLIISLNASPFHMNKQFQRQQVVKERCLESGLPVLYSNLMGGQDELVFDGGSFAMNGNGRVAFGATYFTEDLFYVSFDKSSMTFEQGEVVEIPDVCSMVYDALVTGVRDYVNKNGFKGLFLGYQVGLILP